MTSTSGTEHTKYHGKNYGKDPKTSGLYDPEKSILGKRVTDPQHPLEGNTEQINAQLAQDKERYFK